MQESAMNPHANHADLFKLPAEERLQLAEELWESVAVEQEHSPVPEIVEQLVRERWAEYEANPESAVPWEEVKRRIRER
jgi:putative addiction module component (TIGR02574 family)